jgi:hypothetical protein
MIIMLKCQGTVLYYVFLSVSSSSNVSATEDSLVLG